jgi:hypothetical protein
MAKAQNLLKTLARFILAIFIWARCKELATCYFLMGMCIRENLLIVKLMGSENFLKPIQKI